MKGRIVCRVVPDFKPVDLIPNIEQILGMGCSAEDVGAVLTLMEGKANTYLNIYDAVRLYKRSLEAICSGTV